MGFKLPGKSIQSGTSAHSSALKMKKESMAKMAKNSPMDKALVGKQENLPEDLKAKIEASPAKSKEYDAAAKRDPNLGKYVAERKKIKAKYGGDRAKYRASDEYKANQSKINKAYGIDDGYKAPKSTKTDKTPRVTKTVDKNINKSKTVRRKDGSVKRTVDKNVTVEDGVKTKTKTKETFDKKGNLKKSVYTSKNKGEKDKQKVVYDTKTQNEKRSKSVTKKDGVKRKLKTKYDDKGTQKKQKEVEVKDGRRTVKKYDAKTGETTTKSRRTLKGFLTGKGKKKKEE